MRGQWGFLIGGVVFGLGLVFTGLGLFDSHTTEALPFGVVMVIVGFALSAPSLTAMRTTLNEPELRAPSIDAPSELAPPLTVKCPSCAAPAPLRLSAPKTVSCRHCGTTSALPAALSSTLERAATLARQREAGEQKISAVLSSLPLKHEQLRARIARARTVLVVTSVTFIVFGWSRRLSATDWHGWMVFGALALPVALVVSTFFSRRVPELSRQVVGHWAALKLPGIEGLGCRVCGAPLPSKTASVLTCEFCGADNLAGHEVHALVAHDAAWATTGALAVGRRSAKADELSAFAVLSFPVLTLVVWFAIGAFAGGIGLRALGFMEFAPWSSLPLALVNRGDEKCVAWVEEKGDQLDLRFGGNDHQLVSREEFERLAVEKHLDASSLNGKSLNGRKIEKVYIELGRAYRVEARPEFGGTLYFPSWDLGGELLCVTE
ncbi:MAG: hypothetical protein JNM17_19955 [Archangium sp.]|nr:hypothetical protein [Archangium sp.]